MRRNTIKWRIFKYNIIAIIVLIAMTTIIFNIAVRLYIENNITGQLDTIALHAENTTLQNGPDYFPPAGGKNPPPPRVPNRNPQGGNLFRFYFMLDRSLREPLSVLNADYILLDGNENVVASPQEDYNPPDELVNKIRNEISSPQNSKDEKHLYFTLSGTGYIAVIKPVSGKNNFGLSWIVIYSSLQKLDQLQLGINLILFAILLISALVFSLISSLAAKKISAPFSSLNQHIRSIAERNFSKKINLPADDELQEFIDNINAMSEKLETHDKAQKTFLQNASHEFRTPLMSIQSYAEGIKYDVVDSDTAADIIIDETRRMTRLVEDLLYLSRLDAIEENYNYNVLAIDALVKTCIERVSGIAAANNISVLQSTKSGKAEITGDEEMLSRAFTNILSNCIRYAESTVEVSTGTGNNGMIELCISDDGPGFNPVELPNIFDRFYKGKKGDFGLGLAIAKNIIEKHKGSISAENVEAGALFKILLPACK